MTEHVLRNDARSQNILHLKDASASRKLLETILKEKITKWGIKQERCNG